MKVMVKAESVRAAQQLGLLVGAEVEVQLTVAGVEEIAVELTDADAAAIELEQGIERMTAAAGDLKAAVVEALTAQEVYGSSP